MYGDNLRARAVPASKLYGTQEFGVPSDTLRVCNVQVMYPFHLNCRYPKPCIKLKLIELAISVNQQCFKLLIFN